MACIICVYNDKKKENKTKKKKRLKFFFFKNLLFTKMFKEKKKLLDNTIFCINKITFFFLIKLYRFLLFLFNLILY